MPAIAVDQTLFLVVLVAFPLVAYFSGFATEWGRIGKEGRTIGRAVKRRNPLLFILGRDRRFRPIMMSAGVGGDWHHPDAEMIPDKQGVYSLGGTATAIATVESVSNFNSPFMDIVNEYVAAQKKGELNQLEDAMGVKLGTTPEELARVIDMLFEEKKGIEDRLSLLQEINADKMTVDEYVKAHKLDEKAKKELDRMVADGGKTLKARLEKLRKVGEIKVEQSGWGLTQETDLATGKARYVLYRVVTRNLDMLHHFLPSGSSVHAVLTLVRRKEMEAAARTQKPTDWGKPFGYTVLAIMFLVGLGVALRIMGIV